MKHRDADGSNIQQRLQQAIRDRESRDRSRQGPVPAQVPVRRHMVAAMSPRLASANRTPDACSSAMVRLEHGKP